MFFFTSMKIIDGCLSACTATKIHAVDIQGGGAATTHAIDWITGLSRLRASHEANAFKARNEFDPVRNQQKQENACRHGEHHIGISSKQRARLIIEELCNQ